MMTPKQDRFVLEYMIDHNATQAAIRAGYSEKTAAEIGYEYLRKPHIAEAIRKAQTKRAERLELTAASVTTRLLVIADMAEAQGTPASLSVARQALMDVAKLNGLIVETHETVTRSPEERERRLAELLAERDRLAKRRLN